jgi:hypothetical protein
MYTEFQIVAEIKDGLADAHVCCTDVHLNLFAMVNQK